MKKNDDTEFEKDVLHKNTKRLFQVFLPTLPTLLIDKTCNVIFDTTKKTVNQKKKCFHLKRMDSCDGLVNLHSTRKHKFDQNMDFDYDCDCDSSL